MSAIEFGKIPAFPTLLNIEDHLEAHADRHTYHHAGLSARELYAAMAMQGLCANPDPRVSLAGREQRAEWAVAQADALLAELHDCKEEK